MKKLFDTDHPFFRPLWIRIAIVAVCVAWAGVEFLTASPTWGMIFLAIAAAAIYAFFFDFNPDGPRDGG